MCDPVTLGIAAALGAGGSILGASNAQSNATNQAKASNAVLQSTLGQERDLQTGNTATLNGNIASYAPGSQEAQLADAQAARAKTSVGNISGPEAGPALPGAGAPSGSVAASADNASSSDLAKRMLAVHDGAVNRAGLSAKLDGFGDTWLKNNLNTAEADRNIGVNNNYAEGNKSILAPMQTERMAAAYTPPSVWGTLMSGAGSVAAGAAGAGKSVGSAMPSSVNVSSLWNPIAGVSGA